MTFTLIPQIVDDIAKDAVRHVVAAVSGSPNATRIICLTGSMSFGNVNVGSTGTATLTITNDGNSPLTVSSITYPSGFSGTYSGSIAAGGSQGVTVTFSPVAATAYSGNIVVNADETSGTDTIAASGTGVATEQEQTFTVASAGYDGYWNGSDCTANAATFLLGDRYGALKNLWANFTSVGIPQGATILAATLTLKGVSGDGSFPLTVAIQALDRDTFVYAGTVDDLAAVKTGDRTTASVSWVIGSWAESNTSPDVKDVIQEIVSREGWSSGNGLAIIGTATQVYNKRANVYNADQGAGYEPALYVRWQA